MSVGRGWLLPLRRGPPGATIAAPPSAAPKTERQLGYRAAVTVEKGLRETFQGYLDNAQWWRAVMGGIYQHWIETHHRRGEHVS